MNMVFLIVKTVGISALVLLLCLIFLLILFLFIPFRYRLYISCPETEHGVGICLEYMQARVSIRFLGVLLAFVWEYKNKQGEGGMRVLGIPVWPRRKQGRTKPQEQHAESQEQHLELQEQSAKSQKQHLEPLQETGNIETDRISGNMPETEFIETDDDSGRQQETDGAEENEDSEDGLPGFVRKIMRFPHLLSELFSKICCFFRGLAMAVRQFGEVVEHFSDIHSDIRVRNGIHSLLRECRKLWVHAKPKTCAGTVHFGLSDPAQTGQVLGVFSMVYVSVLSAYTDTLHIEPDFEHAVLNGEITITGKVQIAVLIASAWRLYRDQEVKYAWKRVSQFINSFSFGNNES